VLAVASVGNQEKKRSSRKATKREKKRGGEKIEMRSRGRRREKRLVAVA
jgi:hypothetical protein